MKRRNLLKAGISALIGASFLSSTAFAQQQVSDQDILRALSAYLNGINTMQGNFVQSAPDGRIAEGEFWIRRPGRLRFEYEDPYPTSVISDGTWAAVHNRKSKTVDRLPLYSTPLNLILKENVDLGKKNVVRRIERGPGILRVLAVDPDRPTDGSVTMIFSTNPIELHKWVITDQQNR